MSVSDPLGFTLIGILLGIMGVILLVVDEKQTPWKWLLHGRSHRISMGIVGVLIGTVCIVGFIYRTLTG